ncbi:MAG: carboxypeptidase-like regulatory domain-containing protein, partial [Bryobacteraceae bacterium]
MQIARTAILWLAVCLIAAAQSERGNITGIVTDPTGAAVAAAELSIIHRDTNATTRAVSTATGEYNVPNLLPGVYRVEITATGFKRFVQQNVVVAAATTVRIDVPLQLGQVTEQIEVSAAVTTIQTDNAKVSSQVQNKLVDELPLVVAGEMRSPFNLVAVAAEARGDG